MRHLKKSYILLLLLVVTVTVIIGSRTFAQDLFSSLNLFQEATANPATPDSVKLGVTNLILQSKDGGQTWQDISAGLPENQQLVGFIAGESDIYLHVKNAMYHSKSNLKTPVWEKENVLDPQRTSIVFNPSGVMAYNYSGHMYQKIPAAETWLPIYTNFKKYSLLSVFETSDGTVFLGYDRFRGIYKSVDRGQSWKKVPNQDWFEDMAESEGVLIATGIKGIMRSTDNGENWQYVISEGGRGFAVERIDGGFAAVSYSNITKSRRIRISLDGGETWKAIDKGLQPSSSISSIKQVGNYLLCGHPDGIFRSSDMGKTWSMVHSSVEPVFKLTSITSITGNVATRDNRKVFKLFVSGNVVYAVASHFGC